MILRLFILLFAVMIPQSGLCQPETRSQSSEMWSDIDTHVLHTPAYLEQDTDSLATYFLSVAETDAEKARAIYRWMTDRISFDLDAFFQGSPRYTTPESVLQSKKAVCTGYVILFEELARKMDLNIEFIDGLAKGFGFDPEDSSETIENHSWIAVRIDDEWKLIDPTWGSGFILENTPGFVKNFTEFFFFADPDRLIYTHLPSDQPWQLRSETASPEEFLSYPIVTPHFYKYDLRFGEELKMFTDTNGSFSTHFIVPDNIDIRPALTYDGQKKEKNLLMTFDGNRIEISALLNRTGPYKLELYGRKSGTDQEEYYLMTYIYLNNQSPAVQQHYPILKESYGIIRATLASPLQYELTHTEAYDFDIMIPGAEEVRLASDDWSWSHSLEQDSSRFFGSIVPVAGTLHLIARFPDDDFFVLVTEFKGVE
ncbi:MAG: transglutaminase domain-containing protein [Balneolaceae bacterium]